VLALIPPSTRRIVAAGCGNGCLVGLLVEQGFDVVGIEPSSDGIGQEFDLVIANEEAAHPFAPPKTMGSMLTKPTAHGAG